MGRLTFLSLMRSQLGAPEPAGPSSTASGRVPDAAKLPVVWEGSFFETHSLSIVNRELTCALLETGQVDLSLRMVQLEPIRFDPRSDERTRRLVDLFERPLGTAPVAHIRHFWPPRFERPPVGRWVVMQPWEYGRLPIEWVAPMRDAVDEIWVYSHATRQAYIDSGVSGDKVFVIPLGVNGNRFRLGAPPAELPTKKGFRFLFVGGTIWRKGFLVLLEAYCRTFRRSDDVCLVVKGMGQDTFYRGQDAGDAIQSAQADPDAPEVLYLTDPLPDDALPSLYSACDCLVHPYRGEGFGLPVAEAMACGLPVVVTKGGSCDDFCPAESTYWVSATRQPVKIDNETAGTAWVLEPDPGMLMVQLKAVLGDPYLARERGLEGSEFIRERFTWDRSAQVVLDRLKTLSCSETGGERP